MSRIDMKEFGEAASYLRKPDADLMASLSAAFEGRPDTHTEGV